MEGIRLFIRFSREEDKSQINELMMKCFGDRKHCGFLEHLDGRYLLAFDEQESMLIGMTGLYYSKLHNAYVVDWTCTHPEYRHQGVMQELFSRICNLTDEAIYCSCWRLEGNEHVNLFHVMNYFGFEEVINSSVVWDSFYNCESGREYYCVMQKCHIERGVAGSVRERCKCYEDLYLRRPVNLSKLDSKC